MIKKGLGLTALILITLVSVVALHSKASAAFDQNLLMDDGVFDNTSSMTASQIDAWLNANFPNSCISTHNGFSTPDIIGYAPSTGFVYGGNVSGGTAIYDAALAYGLNPQVLIATLEKESSVVTGNASYHCTYMNTAMGFDCPDSGSCPVHPDTESGFSKQIIWASWFFKHGEQRADGNVGWMVMKPGWDNSDEANCYSGPMTQGTFKRCRTDSSPTFYDGWITIDGTAVHVNSGATAALYWYTPHFHGNQNFVSIFTNWFGGTVSSAYYSCHNATNVAGVGSGAHIVRRNTDGKGAVDNLALVLMNNTGSNCVEAHTWAGNAYQTWYQNTATNLPAVSPADDEIISADIDGSGRDQLILVKLRNTASGRIEIHTWDTTNQHWYSNIATNYPAVDPTKSRVVAADLNGDGKDELILVNYLGGASGRVEVFPWSADYQSFTGYIATNLPSLPPGNNEIIGANTATDGGTNDKLVLVKYQAGASGRIELHTWNPGEQSWYSNIATNYPAVDPTAYQVVSARITGGGKDQLLLAHYNFSGGTSSGRVEIFPWSPGYQGFSAYNISNLSLLGTSP